jgi:hypothetical protein
MANLHRRRELSNRSRVRRELFSSVNGQIMVANYSVQGEAFRAEKPRLLQSARFTAAGPARMFDLHQDGERFAAAPAADTDEHAKRDTVVVILNFFDELRRVTSHSPRLRPSTATMPGSPHPIAP